MPTPEPGRKAPAFSLEVDGHAEPVLEALEAL